MSARIHVWELSSTRTDGTFTLIGFFPTRAEASRAKENVKRMLRSHLTDNMSFKISKIELGAVLMPHYLDKFTASQWHEIDKEMRAERRAAKSKQRATKV